MPNRDRLSARFRSNPARSSYPADLKPWNPTWKPAVGVGPELPGAMGDRRPEDERYQGLVPGGGRAALLPLTRTPAPAPSARLSHGLGVHLEYGDLPPDLVERLDTGTGPPGGTPSQALQLVEVHLGGGDLIPPDIPEPPVRLGSTSKETDQKGGVQALHSCPGPEGFLP